MSTQTRTTTASPKLASYSDSRQIRSFLRGQMFGPPQPISATSLISDLSSRTIIITGSNSGLGLEAAKQLYTLGVGRLVLACRSLQKGEEARRIIEGTNKSSLSAKPTKQAIELFELDMASTSSIIAFSQRAARGLDRIDAIVLNAGVDLVSFQKNEPEGYEMTMMVNVIGTFLLATLMVPILRASSIRNKSTEPPRISIIGSAVQFFAKYDVLVRANASGEGILNYLSNDKRWNGKLGEDRYYLSKGCVQMMVRRLAGLVSAGTNASGEQKKPSVVIHAVQPGYCRTSLFRESASTASRVALKIIGWDAAVGGRTLVIGAVGKEGGEKSHGGYMSEGHVREASCWFDTEQGKEITSNMWNEVAEIIERAQPGVLVDL